MGWEQNYKALYPHEYDGPHFDWPSYRPVQETPEQVAHVRYEYAASLSMCDAYLGKVLDLMDEYDLWDDTMLIINTDHGFLLGEHDWWAKCVQPFYVEASERRSDLDLDKEHGAPRFGRKMKSARYQMQYAN